MSGAKFQDDKKKKNRTELNWTEHDFQKLNLVLHMKQRHNHRCIIVGDSQAFLWERWQSGEFYLMA